jgi:DNA polymerase III epsilon subunit-like protein
MGAGRVIIIIKPLATINTKTLNILAINIYICYMYAIVDIETTGGHASANGITEIAICIHDGKKITRRFETLVNPQRIYPFTFAH